MASSTALVSAAAWGSILAGVLTTCIALVLIGGALLSRGVPVGGAGSLLIIGIGGGLILLAAGPVAVVAGFRLWSGQPWARAFLEIFFWALAAAIIGGIGYQTSRIKELESDNIIRGSLALVFAAGPAIVMAWILRSLSR